MKTRTLILSILLALPMWVLSDDCITIWTNAGQALSYDKDNTPFIGKTQFASAQAGNKLILRGSVTGAGDHRFYFGDWNKDIHIKGGIDNYIGDLPVEVFLTEDMITDIKSKDLRIYGEGITLTSVDLCTSSKTGNMHFGTTIWTGYYWIPAGKAVGNTLRLFKEAIPADLSGYKALRIFHEANSTGVAFNFIKDDWDSENRFATQADMTPKTTTYYDLLLTDAVKTALGAISKQLNIQVFSDSDETGFNMTDVILIPNDPCDNCFFYQY